LRVTKDKLDMKITEHFEMRLKERFGYNLETLWNDVENYKDEIVRISKNSEKLEWYPQISNSLEKHPNSLFILIERINLCMISDNQTLITCYNIN
jgi:hypothetical protein